MGGTLAWWLAALDGSIAAAISIACFAGLATLIETGAHDGHGHYMTVPGLLKLAPTETVCELTAPVPILNCAGLQDRSTPAAAFERAKRDLDRAYADVVAEHPRYVIDAETGHFETLKMRQVIKEFL